jgi:hypothetical protein
MLAVAGYSGFRRRNEDCELIKPDPGVSDAARHKKFAVAATAVLSKPAELTAQFGTVTSSASLPIKPEDYKVPPRSSAAPRLAPDAKFVGQSLYSATYPDYFRDVRSSSRRLSAGVFLAVSQCLCGELGGCRPVPAGIQA